MRAIAVVAVAMVLAGCATKANIQKAKGSVELKAPHDRPVCLMDASLPEGTDAEFLGRGVSNSQWYGGFAGVRKLLANKARASGVDVVADMQYRQVIGFFAVVRPRVYGQAYSLAHPDQFNCIALGGTLYGNNGPLATSFNQGAKATGPASYDDCMARVMRITDPALRLQSMAACDSAK